MNALVTEETYVLADFLGSKKCSFQHPVQAVVATEDTPKFSIRRVVKRLKSLRRVTSEGCQDTSPNSEGTLITQVTSEGPLKLTKEGQ